MTPVTPSSDISPLSAEPTTSAALSQSHYSRAGDAFTLNLGTLPDASNFLLKTALKSPHLYPDSPGCFSFSPTSSTFLNGSGSYKKRSRNMSTTSSTERDMQAGSDQHTPQQHSSLMNGTVNGVDLQSSTAKKRPSDGTIDYPRRRATIACEICRSRKSRCDGNRPKCRLCTELNAECVYREPGIKLDAGDKLILEHLDRIEGLLRTNMTSQQTSSIFGGLTGGSPAASNSTSEDVLMRGGPGAAMGMLPLNGLGTWSTASSNISTMPKIHTTPALHLLQWPMIRDLVSRPYDPQVLLQLEMAREPLQLNSTQCLDLSNTNIYVHAFFDRVNVWYACVNPYNWHSYYRTALSNGFREGPESCIVLLVLALGAASNAGSISQQPRDKEPPGMSYFAAAWSLLPSLMTRNNILAAQCHILASAYLFYIVRPLEAWNLLTNTSMKLQLLLSAPGRLPPHAKELSERVYWNSLLFESDLLAELDLPHSGIVQFEETVGLPGGFEDEGEEPPAGRDELWYFLAEIALRRLLNRVSHLIYTKTSTNASIASLEPLVAELDFQLTQWTIIFRPYILAVLNDESAAMDLVVQENCRRCLEACIRQLEHIAAHHAGHLPYLWQGALSIVSQTLLVMGATMSPSLSALLPPPSTMDNIINDVVVEIERYAHLAPSLRLSAEIIREAEERRQMFLRSAGLKV
ncbi:C6 finger domain-containing protein [Neofusicoccum parvum]|uniref:C6 finger domain-containing protein n=2 Tax=Neofusicoccum parvum TaxID=310453 RepID=A0ACB5SBS7_9PEZI|nr:putative c6 finger domain protein [Neofusicoccum parvum UCRNP2]GME34050.1 C6 finger domain-containing protein [Neofusicoccum parvum]GME39887.1 C6 finger domain-containing protein [Neofusicoccum parvum]